MKRTEYLKIDPPSSDCSPSLMIDLLMREHKHHPTVYDSDRHTKQLLRDAAEVLNNSNNENIRLRAIFPEVLKALQSGGCTEDASIEFLEMIPNEISLVIKKYKNDA